MQSWVHYCPTSTYCLIVVLVIKLFHLLFGMTEEVVTGSRSIAFAVKNPVNTYIRNCFLCKLESKMKVCIRYIYAVIAVFITM